MDLFALYVDLTEAIVRGLGMTHPMVHLQAGLLIYVSVQFLLRTRRASGIALQAVIGAELVNEIMERAFYGSWRWDDTLADIAVTVFWPAMLYLLSTVRRARWTTQERKRSALSALILRQR